MRRAFLIAFLIAAVASISFTVAGCGSSSISTDAGPGGGGTASAPRATDAPLFGVLVDTSTGGNEKSAGRRAAVADTVASAAGQESAHVLVSEYGPGSTAATVRFNKQITYTTAKNGLLRDTQREKAEQELKDAVTGTKTSTTGSLDIIAAVNDLEQHLRPLLPRSGNPQVVIVGDAVQTTTPINLSDPVQLADTTTSIQTLVAQGLLRHGDCAGWRVHMVAASLDEHFDKVRDTQLREFYRQLFAHCGGTLVLYDTDLTAFPAPGDGVPSASWTQPGDPPGDLPVVLPASILFNPDRAVLRPEAEPVLHEVVTLLSKTYPTATADVVGHVAAVPGSSNGSEATADALSLARAEAAASYLEGHGIARSRLSVAGHGDREPIASNDTEEGREQNRRVVITLHVH